MCVHTYRTKFGNLYFLCLQSILLYVNSHFISFVFQNAPFYAGTHKDQETVVFVFRMAITENPSLPLLFLQKITVIEDMF